MSELLIKLKKIILLIGDVGVFYLGLYLTLLARYGQSSGAENFARHYIPFSIVFAAWIIILFISEFYDLKISYNTNSLFNNLIKISIINGVVAVIIFYFFGSFIDTIKPQKVLIIDLAFTFILLFAWRKIFFNFIKSSKIINKVLIIGDSALSQELLEEIESRPQLGYRAEIIDENIDFKSHCLTNNINILISTENLKNNGLVSKKIFDCLSLGIDVYNINGFYEKITNKIPVKYIEHSWFLENLSEHSKKSYEIIKRASDLFIALIGLIIAIPLSPIIALIIKIESPGPIIFKQIRTGRNGKSFLAMKFRSMFKDAEKNGAQWAEKNDPRITRFGLFMRKSRLDEIPQLINILRGEMSLVGPRPERPEFMDILENEIPFYRERLLVKPGLTGWAQLKGPAYGGSKEESLEKIKYDLYYIKNRSILLDLSIILKTIKLVISRRGQ